MLEASPLGIGIGRKRIDRDADVEPRRGADRLTRDVEPVVEPLDHVRQPDRVHIEDRGRIGIARLRRVRCRRPGRQQDVAQPHRVRADQVGLNPDQAAAAARVVNQRFDRSLLLDEHAQRQRARPCPRLRVVRHVDGDRAQVAESPRLPDRGVQIEAARRRHFHHDGKPAVGERTGQARLLIPFRRHRTGRLAIGRHGRYRADRRRCRGPYGG